MVKIVVEIADETNATNISFKVEEECTTEAEEFWKGRLCAVLKNSLGTTVALLGEHAEKRPN
ncbi:MAG TPA: hypothetical protein VKY92_23540 [Verrucomicrobiae bacterium]|nr:hypothetical protein [Verrucomicrobiae bacterium]